MNKKKDISGLIFSAFLVIAYVICAYFFIGLITNSTGLDNAAIILLKALVFVIFGLVLFYATRVGDGKQVKRFSAAALILVDLPALYIILAAAATGIPFPLDLSACPEVVSLAVNCSETGYTVSVLIKIVCLAIDLLELTRAVRAILIAVFDSAGGLDELGNICIPFRQSCGGIVRRNSCRGALHARCDDVVQSVVKLIVYGIDDLSRTVFDLDVHGIHISLAGNTDMTGLDGEGEHSVVSGAVYIAGVFEIIYRGLNPAAAERGGAVTHPVIVSKGRIHFFEKSCRITGVSAVMVEFEDVS